MSDALNIILGGALTLAGGAGSQILQFRQQKSERTSRRNEAMRARAEECVAALGDLRLYFEGRINARAEGAEISAEDRHYSIAYAKCVTNFPETRHLFDEGRANIAKTMEVTNIKTGESGALYQRRLHAAVTADMIELAAKVQDKIFDRIASTYTSDLN